MDELAQQDIAATAAAHTELGRAYDGSVAEGLVERISSEVHRRVDARLAQQGQARYTRGEPPAVPGGNRLGSLWWDETFISGKGIMAGYVLVDVSWTSEEDRQAYLNLFGPSLEAYGGTVTFRSRDVHVMEGDWHPEGLTVLLSFPTLKDALAWYDSEEYRPARDIRQRSSSSRLLIFGE